MDQLVSADCNLVGLPRKYGIWPSRMPSKCAMQPSSYVVSFLISLIKCLRRSHLWKDWFWLVVCYGGNIIWLWWQGPVMTCSYLGRSGSRKMHANIQLPFSLFPSCLVWDHGMELHAFTCPSFNHLWKCTETCLKVCPTKVFPNPVHREFQFLVMVNSYFCREVVIYQAFQ